MQNNRAEITYILPTRNRRQWIQRAIDSCLAVDNSALTSRIIVIDGESDDGSYEELQRVYANQPRVLLMQHSKTAGFMPTCFAGVPLVKTEWVTWMYDDDILSPYIEDIVAKMLDQRLNFVMGYGKQIPVEEVYAFQPITKIGKFPSIEVLLAYYGRGESLDYNDMPLSPICSVYRNSLLQKWALEIQRFANLTSMRHYFMLKRNIGPDLMMYLMNMLENKEMLLASHVVGQFSEHAVSMTVVFGTSYTDVGYWLAKRWAFDRLCERREDKGAAAVAGSYLLSRSSIPWPCFRSRHRSRTAPL